MSEAPLECVELAGFKLRLKPDEYSPRLIESMKAGGYEGGELTYGPKVFTPGDRVLDLGCAIGAMTMLVASIVGPDCVIGFDANPGLIDDARANFALNGMDIYVANAVLRNRKHWGGPGELVDFYIHEDFWVSSLMKSGGTIRTVSVPVLCLEDEIAKFGANTLLVDIEGGEIELLEEADLTNIDKIFMELHYWPDRAGVNRMIRKLICDGFAVDFSTTYTGVVTLHRGLLPPVR